MVQRYGCYLDEGMVPREAGPWVHYEAYEQLHAIVCRLTDHINLSGLPDSLYEELEEIGLL